MPWITEPPCSQQICHARLSCQKSHLEREREGAVAPGCLVSSFLSDANAIESLMQMIEALRGGREQCLARRRECMLLPYHELRTLE